jgi:hypothetical protein
VENTRWGCELPEFRISLRHLPKNYILHNLIR